MVFAILSAVGIALWATTALGAEYAATAATVIGSLGFTGSATGPHLHLHLAADDDYGKLIWIAFGDGV